MIAPHPRLSAFLTAAAVVVLIGTGWWASRTMEEQVERLSSGFLEAYELEIDLERALGYGGLIHSFKNALLRPTETEYLEQVLEQSSRARSLLVKLEDSIHSRGVEASLDATQAVIEAYESHVPTVRRMLAEGVSPEQIDAAVRVSDEGALQEIDQALKALATATQAEIRELLRTGRLYGLLLGLLILATVIAGLTATHARSNERKLELFSEELEAGKLRVEAANERLQQFAAIASHDLKSPAQSVAGLTDILLDGNPEKDLAKDCLGRIRSHAMRMSALVNSLLEFTKRGYTVPERVDIETQALMEGVTRQLHEDIGSSGAEVSIHPLPPCFADPDLLERVFTNLLQNGIKFTPPGSTPWVEISGTAEGDRITFSVADHGIGIDADYAHKIFEPMRRLHATTSTYKGSGLGLSLVKAIVEAHHGTVWLDTSYEQGSRFQFSLPQRSGAPS